MSCAVTLAARPHAESESESASEISLTPDAWLDTRWVGERSGYATTRDLLAGAWVPDPERRAVYRLYAAACADLAQATLGGVPPHSADWDRWFGTLRSAARELSPANAGAHVVRRALHHGARLEGAGASWAHRLRRGFAALLSASLSEPIPALIGEDLAVFRAHDAAWLAQDTAQDGAQHVPGDPRAPGVTLAPPDPECSRLTEPVRWPTASLRPHPLNPRGELDPADVEELTASIVAHAAQGGILQPLLVTPDGTVVAGHRRLAAARRAGLADVPVIVHSLTTIEVLAIQLTENLQRSDLSLIEEARAYGHLLDAGATQASIARAVGVPASRVRERLALLDLDQRVQEMVHRGELALRVALQLLPLRDQARQRRLARHAIRRRLTAAQVRQLIDTALAVPPAAAAPLPADHEPNGGGLSLCRREALEALRAVPDRPITFGQLAALAEQECCACGLASTPTICAECPNLHLLQAVLRRQASRA